MGKIDFVQIIARLYLGESQELMMKQENANIVNLNLQQINIVNQYSVDEVVVIEICGIEDVWNMEVIDNHNFFVNGGLCVHNCIDAVRYSLDDIIMSKGWRLPKRKV